MKKRRLIYIGIALLTCLLVVFYTLLRKERPEYLTLEIPMPQNLPTYAGKYAESEEFSTHVMHGIGPSHHYFIYRMYVPVHLGEQGFENKEDVYNYYDGWLKKLGWQEERSDVCNYHMIEFLPEGSYRAYIYPSNYYPAPRACLIAWSEFGDEDSLTVLVKTINPSKWEDWD